MRVCYQRLVLVFQDLATPVDAYWYLSVFRLHFPVEHFFHTIWHLCIFEVSKISGLILKRTVF